MPLASNAEKAGKCNMIMLKIMIKYNNLYYRYIVDDYILLKIATYSHNVFFEVE